jgi:hypothetical protein
LEPPRLAPNGISGNPNPAQNAMPVNGFEKEKAGASFECAREHGTVLIARNDHDRHLPIKTSGTYLLGRSLPSGDGMRTSRKIAPTFSRERCLTAWLLFVSENDSISSELKTAGSTRRPLDHLLQKEFGSASLPPSTLRVILPKSATSAQELGCKFAARSRQRSRWLLRVRYFLKSYRSLAIS